MKYSYSKDACNLNLMGDEIRNSDITIALDYLNFGNGTLDIFFKAELSTAEVIILEGLVQNHVAQVDPVASTPVVVSNFPIGLTTKSLKTTSFKPETFSTTIVTHDFMDKTTWYTKSVRVTDAVLTQEGLTFSSEHTHWVDLTHGKVYLEDTVNASGAYSVIVKIDDVVQTDGFEVNYNEGKVVFDNDPGGVVKATYSYATESTWILAPYPGKKILIEHTELQFARNVQITNPIDFEMWVYNPHNLPNKFLYNRLRYKNIKDILNANNLGQGYIPAIGGLANDVLVFPFNYASLLPLQSSVGG
jgi:hypothetical protein